MKRQSLFREKKTTKKKKKKKKKTTTKKQQQQQQQKNNKKTHTHTHKNFTHYAKLNVKISCSEKGDKYMICPCQS